MNLSKKIICTVFLLIITWNFTQIILMGANRKFTQDEFQHTHITWCIKEKAMLPYIDFFEHHGPLYYYLNAALWKASSIQDTNEILFLFRYSNIFLGFIICILTYLLSRKIFSISWALIAIVLLTSHSIFQNLIIEIRPDSLIIVFWIFSLLLLFKNMNTHSRFLSLLIGLLWGLLNACMIKTMFLIIPLLIYLSFTKQTNIITSNKNAFFIFTGWLSVWIIFIIYFFIHDGSIIFLKSQFFWNILITFFTPKESIVFINFLKNNYVFFSLLLICLYEYLIIKTTYKNKIHRILLGGTILGLISVIGPFYEQHWFMFLPILSIFCTNVLNTQFATINLISKKIFFILITLFFIRDACSNSVINLNNILSVSNKKQVDFLQFIQDKTNPNQILLYFWGDLGGYIFRPHLNYYWWMDNHMQKTVYYLEKKDILKHCLSEKNLKKYQPVIILEDEELKNIPKDLILIINKYYKRNNIYPVYFLNH
ncbi:MAG: hypothetical protein ACD_79C00039G0002 [uncultured bacterium]|nr:MAG: hypothetical protein ACD_79C00039G0002 [uncultured bacterium]